jgi:anthranilate phosphoribosyltransferase
MKPLKIKRKELIPFRTAAIAAQIGILQAAAIIYVNGQETTFDEAVEIAHQLWERINKRWQR